MPPRSLRPWSLRLLRHLPAATRLRPAGRLLRRALQEYFDDHCPQLAAAISYHVLFSVFPLAIVGVGVLGLVAGDDSTRDAVVSAVVRVVPLTGTGQRQVRDMLDSIGGSAGALGLLGVLGAIWSATGVMAAARTAVNIAWDTTVRRPLIRGKAFDLLLVAATLVLLGAALGGTLAASFVQRRSQRLSGPAAAFTGPAIVIVTLCVTLGLVGGVFLAIYRFVPAVPTRVRDVWPGAVVAAAGFEALQYGFSSYVAHFASYNRVYGSLGTVIAFLVFVYLASSVFLFGAEVASEYPRLRRPAPGSAPPAVTE